MPTLFHSRLQRNLVNAINKQTKTYEAIQELRCIVPPLSLVPGIAIYGETTNEKEEETTMHWTTALMSTNISFAPPRS